jgi:2-polyprenyl-3-methyl-5-hydroxy-6-metoxy-1,4-benzoquinol methylase
MDRVVTDDQLDRPASRADVLACYRLFLGREPENDAAVTGHLANSLSLWTLIAAFERAPEARRLRLQTASSEMDRDIDSRNVALAATEAQRTAIIRHIEAVWSSYGREDAYYSVLTNPRYHLAQFGVRQAEEFYATGEEEVASFIDFCRRNGAEFKADMSVVELGCGVGRCAEFFSRRFVDYTGVDISAGHLALAEARMQKQSVGNSRFEMLNEHLSSDKKYDIFYSLIVLQHNPPPVIEMLVDSGLEKLNPGGYAYFQVPCFLYNYRFEAQAYLDGEGRADHMEIHALPQRDVFALLSRHRMTPIAVVPNSRIGPIGLSFTFLARKSMAG